MNDFFIKFIEKLASIDNTLLFAVSIIPYAIFLFYLYKINSVNIFIKTGFSLTVLFVFITILVSIFTLNYYDKTLVEVDFLHGLAESFLTLSDFVILYGLVTLQGIFTFIGNSTLALASFIIFKKKETYE